MARRRSLVRVMTKKQILSEAERLITTDEWRVTRAEVKIKSYRFLLGDDDA